MPETRFTRIFVEVIFGNAKDLWEGCRSRGSRQHQDSRSRNARSNYGYVLSNSGIVVVVHHHEDSRTRRIHHVASSDHRNPGRIENFG